MSEARRSPHVNLTLSPVVLEALDDLAAEDAERTGADPRRQRSATVAALVLAERDRRAKRKEKKAS